MVFTVRDKLKKIYRLYTCPLLIALVNLLSFCGKVTAQDRDIPFTPQSKIIFLDDFGKVSQGKFPNTWKLAKCSGGPFLEAIGLYKVLTEDSTNILRIDAYDQPFIEPKMSYMPAYLGNDFTVEYDFAFTPGAEKIRQCMHFILPGPVTNCEAVLFRTDMTPDGNVVFGYESYFPRHRKQELILDKSFNLTSWHHFALSFRQQQIRCYLDNKNLLTIDTCGYLPARIALHGGFSPIKYKNVKVAIAPRPNLADSILNGKRFVSHAIYFDVDKHEIKPESDPFLLDLVQFLATHRSLHLEISGHTDNSGNEDANKILSLNRANAIRDYLIVNKIDSTRLITKGYGDTRPVQTNNSTEGREKNRRVEFLKLSN